MNARELAALKEAVEAIEIVKFYGEFGECE